MTTGKLIVIEGIDGAGKTTQVLRLMEKIPGSQVFREPGSTPAGERIRSLLLNKELDLNVQAETMLFMAARAMLMVQINDLLRDGVTVVMDRGAYSTFAYQHILTKQVWEIMTEFACQGRWPDLTIWLDADVKVGRARTANKTVDRFESRPDDYYEETRQRYHLISKTMPNIHMVDAHQNEDVVEREIWDIFTRCLGGPRCDVCGTQTVRVGGCYKCQNCGNSMGVPP